MTNSPIHTLDRRQLDDAAEKRNLESVPSDHRMHGSLLHNKPQSETPINGDPTSCFQDSKNDSSPERLERAKRSSLKVG